MCEQGNERGWSGLYGCRNHACCALTALMNTFGLGAVAQNRLLGSRGISDLRLLMILRMTEQGNGFSLKRCYVLRVSVILAYASTPPAEPIPKNTKVAAPARMPMMGISHAMMHKAQLECDPQSKPLGALPHYILLIPSRLAS